jgi:hypothetical protein
MLVIKMGIVLERWLNGLPVMLQTIFGCTLIAKLRSILLMEANFNAANKQIYGIKMLDYVRKYTLLPKEIYSRWNKFAGDRTLSKIFFYDIVRQLCQTPTSCLAAVDIDNC